MPEKEEYLLFIKELGRLFNDYNRSPKQFKKAILEDIKLLGEVIDHK